MAKRENGSNPDIPEILTPQTPTAEALWDFRTRVYRSKVGPGAIKELAETLGIDRGRLNKMLTPSNIRIVAEAEKEIARGDDNE